MPLVVTDEGEEEQISGAGGANATLAPIDRLRPKSELHTNVLNRLMERVRLSRRHMSQFHDRWRASELQYQAYIRTETMDALKKASTKRGTPPELVTITIPYTYASVQTIITYLVHTFCGRSPMFQVGSHRDDMVRRAENMETVLQFNGDHERVVRKLWQFFHDGELYGLQVLRTTWKVEERVRTIWKPSNVLPILGQGRSAMQPVKETAVTFEGNDVRNVDPYKFLPDPRVPLEEVNSKGEFVFWREYEGQHSLRKAEKDGLVKWVDDIPGRQQHLQANDDSERGRLSGGGSTAWKDNTTKNPGYDIIQGSVEIVPSEWGLGESDRYEKWMFSIANEGQIVQAEPLDLDHNRHPVIVGEPYSSGYEFGSISVTDMLGPMQEMLSWMFNSHLFNVRSALNNTFLVNPQMIDMDDLKKPGPGRVIKTKPAAFGQDLKNAFMQVPVADVTTGHVQDMQIVQRFGDLISATNDNLRGVTNTGGRKSATEIRQSGEAGASRLAAHARLESAQSMTPFAEMCTVNIQQNMSEAVYLKLLGNNAQEGPIRIGPEDLSGDFYFPVHDGTLPLDRVALLEVWKEIFGLVIQNPGLAQIFDAVGMFEYIAELGGAKNLSTFKVEARSNEAVAAAVAQGNMVPTSEAAGAV